MDAQSTPERTAALMAAHLDVFEQTPLHSIGRSYRRPVDADAVWTGVVGWPFVSWALGAWLDAGLMEMYFLASIEPDRRLRDLGWLDQAVVDGGFATLRTDDARALLADTSLWWIERSTSEAMPAVSDAGAVVPYEEWARIAFASKSGPPPLGENPEMRAAIEWQNARIDWESFGVKVEFDAGGTGPGRIVERPQLFIVRQQGPDGDTWARLLAPSEEAIRAVHPNVEIWPEQVARRDLRLSDIIEPLRKRVPQSLNRGFVLAPVTPIPKRIVDQRVRNRVIEHLELAASFQQQLDYDRDVPIAWVPGEVINGWDHFVHADPATDPNLSDVYTRDEVAAMARFHAALSRASDSLPDDATLATAHALPQWGEMRDAAREASVIFARRGTLPEEWEAP